MNKYEVERKRSLSSDRITSLHDKLREQGFEQISQLSEVDSYYSRNDVNYMETVECLRVRSRSDFAEITYKPPSTKQTTSQGIVMKQELNVILQGANHVANACQLLETIGMIPLARVEKNRTVYSSTAFSGVIVAIDKVTGVGCFIEVEVMSHDKQAASTHLEKLEQLLSIADLPIITKPYRDLVMESHQKTR